MYIIYIYTHAIYMCYDKISCLHVHLPTLFICTISLEININFVCYCSGVIFNSENLLEGAKLANNTKKMNGTSELLLVYVHNHCVGLRHDC